jgi:two-component system, NarL family, sensor histidine kinase DesK
MTTSRRRWPPRMERVERARLVVLAILLTNVPWVVGLPVLGTRAPTGPAVLLLWVLVAVLAVALVLVLWAAVTPWLQPRTRGWLMAGLVAATLAWWPVAFAWALPGAQPWAWVAGFAVGVAPLVLRWPAALGVGALLTAAAGAGALVFDEPVVRYLAITLGLAAVTVLMGQVVVWMLRLLVAAEAGREAEAGLAVSQERLRFARELHDVLGHRLGVIALKAELAGELVDTDPERVRVETADIRGLASTTLREVRAAVHGYGTIDLSEQLRAARLVLTSAGVDTELTVDELGLGPAESQLVAAVVREAVTNILRHSDAQHVSIDLTRRAEAATLVIMNDRPRPGSGAPGMGLSGLADRCAPLGARLRSGPVGDGYQVRVELTGR